MGPLETIQRQWFHGQGLGLSRITKPRGLVYKSVRLIHSFVLSSLMKQVSGIRGNDD